MDYNSNDSFAGMYLSNEIRFDGLVNLIKAAYRAVQARIVMVPASLAFSEMHAPLA